MTSSEQRDRFEGYTDRLDERDITYALERQTATRCPDVEHAWDRFEAVSPQTGELILNHLDRMLTGRR